MVLIQWFVVVILIIISVEDARTMEISDRWILLLGGLGIVSVWLEPEILLADRIVGALCVSLPMYLLCMVIPNAFGGGDLKLVSAMGFYLGWERTLAGMFLAVLLGGIQAIGLMVMGKVKIGEHAHMAFGPALCAGMIASGFWGNEMIRWYFSFFF